jgi:uncharacterized repeat protein (TIGR01451 family)
MNKNMKEYKIKVKVIKINKIADIKKTKKAIGRISIPFASGVTVAAMIISLIIPILSLAPLSASAATVGPNNGSSFANDSTIGTINWSNPSNAQTSNSSRAIASLDDNQVSRYLKATNFGFSVPGGATINGIKVDVQRQAENSNRIKDNSVKIVKGGNIGTANKANSADFWGTSDDYITYGSASDLWGETWTPADINATNFGFVFAAKKDTTSGNQYEARVNHIRITVSYTEAPAVQPATNPELSRSCGIDIALVLDNSGSIDGDLSTMRNDFNSFVGDLLPATPTQFSVTYFSDQAHYALQTFSNNVSTITSAVNTVLTASGSTNWQDGLLKAQGTFDPRPSVPNLIIFASDGNPTVNNNPTTHNPAQPGDGSYSPGTTDGNDLINAITVANSIKASGIRIVTLGIGASVDQANLESISSADAYYSAATFSQLPATLTSIVTALCGGTITAHKVIDQDGNIQTTGDQTPGAGWNFTVAGHADATNANGSTLSWDVNAGTYDVTEALQSGYSFITAFCTGATDNGELLGQDQISNIQVGNQDVVSCTFYNSPNAGTLTVYKHVINDFGGQAVAGDFHIVVNDGNLGSFFGDENGTQISVPAGAEYLVQENGASDGYSVSYDGCSGTMEAGDSAACTITNTQNEPESDQGTLTVIKSVVNDNGGQAAPENFSLFVGQSQVTNGASNNFDPGDYAVSESGGPSGYSASFSGDCDQNGNITIAAGNSYTCTITNDDQPATLIVKKVISGGTLSAADFSFSVNDSDLIPFDTDAQNDLTVDPGVYTVTEPGVDNFTTSYDNCSEVQIGLGQTATCTITNTFVPPEQSTDVGMDKSVDPSTVQSGNQATFTMHVVNHGPLDATNVVVTDALPAGLTFVSSNADAGSYDSGTDLWTIGALANGATATLTIVVTVSGSDSQQIVNNASLTIDPNIDINSENNSASATVTVTVPSQGGGGGSSEVIISDGGGGGYSAFGPSVTVAQAPAATPPGEVLGESTNTPSAPQTLPATGFDVNELLAILSATLLLAMFAIGIKRYSEKRNA